MTDPFDGWSVAAKIESPAHVHAFGMIAMNAAIMEEVLTLLLAHFLRLPHDISFLSFTRWLLVIDPILFER